jgi:hypothetical protein
MTQFRDFSFLQWGNIVPFTVRFLDVANVLYANSIINTNFVQSLIPSCGFEIPCPTYFGIEIF